MTGGIVHSPLLDIATQFVAGIEGKSQNFLVSMACFRTEIRNPGRSEFKGGHLATTHRLLNHRPGFVQRRISQLTLTMQWPLATSIATTE
jgi:hypothetical protein